MSIGDRKVAVRGVRAIPDPPGIRQARTLPASWYSDPTFFEHERQRVFRQNWVAAGVTDELPAPGAWSALTVGGVPILLVRDRDGRLRGFLNVCRHRAAPLCDDEGSGSLIRCPYHSWLYRLDGSLARASGVGEPEGFDLDDYSLKPVGVAMWRRTVFVHVGDPTAALDLGPLADAVRDCPFDDMDMVLSERHERHFNWKVLLENYSENYHTPFIHPEIDTSATEDYPMVSDGAVLYAWDRLNQPGQAADEVIRSTMLPGEPGWEQVFAASTQRPYDVGSYLTIWPNVMLNLFPDAALVMWIEPTSANTTVVQRRLYVVPGRSATSLQGILDAHRLVHEQDVSICEAVQRSHDAGLDADGVLATVEERGVYFVHQHLRAALVDSL
ncbi:aromatic ring-hydroxylating dioxygenase subunit alpha [Ilumatobacter sp.]|uniref:aromatic ring-hydroxylating oxygenase subunit alpha n=1 Tax=Ilumatobacter sp. TaxID=1967498 RepID=UPI003751E8C0